MKAIVFDRYGPPDVLEIKSIPDPVPGDQEVLVKVHAVTVIKGDCELRSFDFPYWFWLPLRLYVGLFKPRVNIAGQELAGEIVAIGKNVQGLNIGDQIVSPTGMGFGAHAQFKCLSTKLPIVLKPAGLSFEEVVTLPTGGLNAYHYVKMAKIKPGEQALINGACGNIGSFAVQLSKHFGAQVTGVDHGSKFDYLRSLGADHAVDYTKDDFTRLGFKFDVILDVVGNSNYSRCIKMLNPGGRYLNANPGVTFMIRSMFTPLFTDKKVQFRFAPYHKADLEFLVNLMAQGALKASIDRRFSFEQIPEAHAYIDTGMHQGNVVVSMDK